MDHLVNNYALNKNIEKADRIISECSEPTAESAREELKAPLFFLQPLSNTLRKVMKQERSVIL